MVERRWGRSSGSFGAAPSRIWPQRDLVAGMAIEGSQGSVDIRQASARYLPFTETPRLVNIRLEARADKG